MARRLADEKDAAATERGLIFSHRLWINFRLSLAIRKRNRLNV
jgi:hypothetical protein